MNFLIWRKPRPDLTFPVHLRIGSLDLPLHLVCEILAYSLGYQYYRYLRRNTRDLISDADRIWIFIGAAGGAFLFSHLLGVLEQPLPASGLTLPYILGNKTVAGGFLGGLIGVELIKKAIGVRTSSGDLMTYPLILGLMTGRVGCFLEGLEDGTYGIPSTLPWAMDLGDGLRRHPTNLYEIAFLLLLWLSLTGLEKRRTLSNGSRFKLFLSAYLLFRFAIEFIKPAYGYPIGLSAIQLACLAGLIYYYRVFLFPQHLFVQTSSCPKDPISTTTLR